MSLGSIGHAEEQCRVAAELRGGGAGRGSHRGRGVRGTPGCGDVETQGAEAREDPGVQGEGEWGRGGTPGCREGVNGDAGSGRSESGAWRARDGRVTDPGVREGTGRSPRGRKGAPSARRAEFTLMSGDTCTGGTILSVTFAPEAQSAERGNLKGGCAGTSVGGARACAARRTGGGAVWVCKRRGRERGSG